MTTSRNAYDFMYCTFQYDTALCPPSMPYPIAYLSPSSYTSHHGLDIKTTMFWPIVLDSE